MWVMLNDSFLSIVAHRTRRTCLLVRARRHQDIAVIFPHAKIIDGGGTDYEFRAVIKRRTVEAALVEEVKRINYDNFKDSIPPSDVRRHDVYLTVWTTLMRLANNPLRRFHAACDVMPVEQFDGM